MASAVTILPASRVNEYPPSNLRKCIEATVVADGTDGSPGTPIPATAFELQFIEQAANFVKSDNTAVLPASPTYNGAGLMAVPTSHGVPAALPAGTYFIVLEGY